MIGDSERFTRQDGIEEAWRVHAAAARCRRPRVHAYAPGTWGPNVPRTRCSAGHGRWHDTLDPTAEDGSRWSATT